MRKLVVKGKASSKEVASISLKESDLQLTLLEFLSSHQIPIASSCGGEGVCKLCKVNQNLLSCQIKVSSFTDSNASKLILVDYL